MSNGVPPEQGIVVAGSEASDRLIRRSDPEAEGSRK